MNKILNTHIRGLSIYQIVEKMVEKRLITMWKKGYRPIVGSTFVFPLPSTVVHRDFPLFFTPFSPNCRNVFQLIRTLCTSSIAKRLFCSSSNRIYPKRLWRKMWKKARKTWISERPNIYCKRFPHYPPYIITNMDICFSNIKEKSYAYIKKTNNVDNSGCTAFANFFCMAFILYAL